MCSRGPAPASEPATPGANTWPLAMAAAAVLCSTLVLVRALAPTATPSALFAAPHAATARPIVGGMPVPRVQPVRSHASEPFAAASRWPEVSAAAAAAATAPEAAHPRPRAGADGVARAGLALLAGAMSVAALLHTARRFLPTRPQCLDPLDLGADYGATRVAMAATTASAPTPKEGVRRLTAADSHETDVVVIGSGLGGLCCAAMLAHNGLRVTVLESHEHLGGCAHDFKYGPYTFESGPSLYSGFTAPGGESFNPLQHVFQIIGEEPEWIQYDRWGTFLPEGNFCVKLGPDEFEDRVLMVNGGEDAVAQWRRLMARLVPLSEGAQGLPATVIREDLGALPILLAKYPKALLATIQTGQTLNSPFKDLLDEQNITNQFIRNWLDLLCFLLQGLPAKGCLNAVMSYMMADWYRPGVCLDYPKGGSGAIVDALTRGVTKHADKGCKVLTEGHVTEVLVSEAGVANGVRVKTRKGEEVVVKAAKAVVCNADLWTTRKLVPQGINAAFDEQIDNLGKETPQVNYGQCTPHGGIAGQVNSFIHLHAAIDAEGLPTEASEDFPAQWAVVNTWAEDGEGVEAPRNVVLVSMPSLLDPSLAPAGKHVIHAYTPATEAYELWEGMDRDSEEYKAKKEEAAQFLWSAVEKSVPGARGRAVLEMVGTPLTHERFLRRDRGTYGPRIEAGGDVNLTGHKTPLPGFYMTGDSTFPGIGVPAVAAAGAITANTILSIPQVWNMADKIKLPAKVPDIGAVEKSVAMMAVLGQISDPRAPAPKAPEA